MAINKHPLFKGHVKIELSDGQKVEGDNMVTNAVNYFFKKGGITNRSAFNASYISGNALYYLLGGVMCLDTALTQDAEVVRVPAGVGMTANGARDISNNGAPTELGTYNAIESGMQQDGSLKMVWDWPTSGGNGTIAAVCLTSAYGGMAGIGNKTLERKNNSWAMDSWNSVAALSGIDGTPIAYKDNKLYAVQSFYNVTKWTINVYDFPYTQIDIRDNMTARLVDSYEVNIPAEVQNLSAGGQSWDDWGYKKILKHQNGDTITFLYKYGYMGTTSSYARDKFTDANPLYVLKMTLSTGAVSLVASLTPTSTGIPAVDSFATYYSAGISDRWAIIEDYAVDLSNLANVHEFENGTGLTDADISPMYEDKFIYYSSIYDCVTFKKLPLNNNGYTSQIGTMPDNPLMLFRGSSLYRDPQYIATIFNLSSPITKTADKTMKVTYVLRFPA